MTAVTVSLGSVSSSASRANFLEEGVQRLGPATRCHRGGAIGQADPDDAIKRPDGGEGRALKRCGKDDELFAVLKIRSAGHGEPYIPSRPTNDGHRDGCSRSALQRLLHGK